MSRNKYQRRRGVRPSTTAPSAVQSELFQHPVQQPTSSSSSTDVGREAARQIKENQNPNTRFIDKPDATSNKNLLRQAQNRQQAAMGSVQRQVLGDNVNASLKPSGAYRAPSVPVPPRQLQLVAQGGGIRLGFAPTVGANLLAAGAAAAVEEAAQPLIGWLAEKLARGMYEGKELITGDTDGVTFDEMQDIFSQVKQNVEMQRQQGNPPTAEEIEAQIEELRQKVAGINKPHSRFGKPESQSLLSQFSEPQLRQVRAAATLEEKDELLTQFKKQNLEAQVATPEQLDTPLQAAMPQLEEKPILDERNREYQIRRAALGDNPTKEEMLAVVAYGLQQHRLHFPHLYED